jgi:putative ABC transport system ATP-binding protein
MITVQLQGVTKEYRLGKTTVNALRGVDLVLTQGDFAALCGPSGSGKSSLLHIIGCLDRPTSGTVQVLGSEVLAMSDRQLSDLRSRELGFVFQSFNLIPVLTAQENIEYPLLLTNIGAAERRRRVTEMLRAVQLEPFAHHRPSELSGGQQQRVAIARALITRPRLVLADEPTANLDTATGTRIIELMREMRDAFHCTFLFSTHDVRILRFADRIFSIEDGLITNIQETGSYVESLAAAGDAEHVA